MDLKIVMDAKVFEGDKVIGDQVLTLILPDSDDTKAALNCLAEGQINFSKIAEQAGIAAVWIAARVLNDRLEAEEAAKYEKNSETKDL